jgi:hypothetical protein
MNQSVRRLSRLRKHSLLVHAVCNRWAATQQSHVALLEQSALMAWLIAHVATVWLYRQPSRHFQPGPAPVEDMVRAASAWLRATLHPADRARLRWLRAQIQELNQETGLIYALSLSAEFDEMLWRCQPILDKLAANLREISGAAQERFAPGAVAHRRVAIFVNQDRWSHFSR